MLWMTPGKNMATLTVSTRADRRRCRRCRRDCAARDRRGDIGRRIIGVEKQIKRGAAENGNQRKRRSDVPVLPQTGADAARCGFRSGKVQHFAWRAEVQIRVDAHSHTARALIAGQRVPLRSLY